MTDIKAFIEELKRLNPLEDVVNEFDEFRVGGRGDDLKGINHDSFVVFTKTQTWTWFSRGAGYEGRDVVEFLDSVIGMGFKGALEWLARRANITSNWTAVDAERIQAERMRTDALTIMMQWLNGRLLASPSATSYCEGRGWSKATVQGCGYWNRSMRAELRKHLQLHEIDVTAPIVEAIMNAPDNMLIYGHWVGNRCEYVSYRSLEGKRHYNPPRDLMGERRSMWNISARGAKYVVVVEGQADVLTLEQWGIPAVALAGVSATDGLMEQLARYDRVFVAMDDDVAGKTATGKLAVALGPQTRVVTWPPVANRDKVDCNDWAVFGDGSAEACEMLLGNAPIYAIWLCDLVKRAKPMERETAMKLAVEAVASLPPYALAKWQKSASALLGIGLTDLAKMIKAIKGDGKSGGYKQDAELNNGFLDGYLFETIYQADHEDGPRTAFAVRDPNGVISIKRVLETDHYRITPPPPFNSIIQQEVIKLPSGLDSYGSDTSLQQEIQQFIHKYVDLPHNLELMASYYVMLSWVHDKFYTIPILRARGDYGSGKSRFLEAVGYLCMRTVLTSGSTTPSPFFRLNEMWHGMTLALDEADLPNSEASVEWMQMLNNGYKKGMPLLRTKISNGNADVEAFSVFGPKIIGMRGRFPDHATESRCLTWETSAGRAIRADIDRYYDRDEFEEDARRLRNKLLQWRLSVFTDIEVDYNNKEFQNLPGRTIEIMVPLQSISQEPAFRESIRKFMEEINDNEIMTRQTTLPAKVLLGLITAYCRPDSKAHDGDERDLLAVGHITRWTNRTINRENEEGELDDDGEDDGPANRKRSISSRKIGALLRNELNLQIKRSTSRNKARVVDWDETRINALIIRYGYEQEFMDLLKEKRAREELLPLYAENKLPNGEERTWLEKYLKSCPWFKPEIKGEQDEILF